MKELFKIAGLSVLSAFLCVCAADTSGTPPKTCSDGIQNEKETDIDCGGGDCAPCAVMQNCELATDCTSSVCVASMCQTPTCFNGAQDGTESDVDCGGAACGACIIDKKCGAASDCASGLCQGGTCKNPSCTNAQLDRNETDIDCGGGCAKCATGMACKGGADCVSGACTSGKCAAPTCSDALKNGTETDVDCGGSCGACKLGRSCAVDNDCGAFTCDAGKCGLGTGADGPLNVPAGNVAAVNSVFSAVTGTAGSKTLNLSSPTGFAVGQEVFIHQSQNSGTNKAGKHELAKIVSLTGGAATLATALSRDYTGAAQAIVVPQYTTVSIGGGALLNSPAWNGTAGGILVFKATGKVSVDGNISMGGLGFRGGGVTNQCVTNTFCAAPNGLTGESELGASVISVVDGNQLGSNSGAGGGGGTRGRDCASGGGGAHATPGGVGMNGTNALCNTSTIHGGGEPGATVGVTDLTQSMFMGGGGGQGGPDDDGTHPGPGGNGGGIIVIYAGSIVLNDMTGHIDANGSAGGGGLNNGFPGCGVGGGSGEGSGGGGAAGSIRLFTGGTTSVGTGLITALGGSGGPSCANRVGGVGGDGRIHIRAGGYQLGLTNPLAYAQ